LLYLQAVLSEQLEVALQHTQASLQATEQMLQQTGGLAEQQAHENMQLQAQVEQVSIQMHNGSCHVTVTELSSRCDQARWSGK
jgi:hypothetical protein